MFSDEMNIEVDNRKGRVMMRRLPSEKYNEDCLQQRGNKSFGSIGLWACMSYQGVPFFEIYEGRMDAVRYRDILDNKLLPAINLYQTIIFQQDNAPCHTAKIINTWMDENDVETLDWPPYSPDLSCIENLWSWLDRQLAKHRITDKEMLKERVTEIMNSVPVELCQNLVDSMPRRLIECVQAKGGMTRY
jgi:transposase